MPYGVGLIGCGSIGRKRAASVTKRRDTSLVVCADTELSRTSEIPGHPRCTTSWREAVHHPNVDIVIVSTTHDMLAEITQEAVWYGKHVLVEKPAARSCQELDAILAIPHLDDVCVHVGFNHRYHPALSEAHAKVEAGDIGTLMFVRGRYGHGGRLGYEKEWRANPKLSGGGELIDQGVHLIDLSRWFLGDFPIVSGQVQTYFWDMPVDDNAFLTLQTHTKQTAFLHASCTEWKNLFSLEIYGQTGKLVIEGLGGSYGPEKLTHYEMLPEMGPPKTHTNEYVGYDASWDREFDDFMLDITHGVPSNPGLRDARAVLSIVEQVYRQSSFLGRTPYELSR